MGGVDLGRIRVNVGGGDVGNVSVGNMCQAIDSPLIPFFTRFWFFRKPSLRALLPASIWSVLTHYLRLILVVFPIPIPIWFASVSTWTKY